MNLFSKHAGVQPAELDVMVQLACTWQQDTCARLLRITGGNDAALFNCVVSALGIVLHRYTGNEEIRLNTPVLELGEERPDENPVTLLLTVSGDSTLRAYLNETQTAIGHAYLSGNYDAAAANIMVQYTSLHRPIAAGHAYDILFTITWSPGALSLQITYDPSYFDAAFISNIPGHMEKVFSFFDDLNTCLTEIDILTAAEHDQLNAFNATAKPFPANTSIVQLFDARVLQQPQAPAVVDKGRIFSYSELNQAANNLAYYLQRSAGIQPGDIVGVMTARSAEWIIAMLAILKAGAAYLPIDPKSPRQRQQHLLTETDVQVLLSESQYAYDLDFFEGELFALDLQLPGLEPGLPVDRQLSGDALAYVIYTSGSTGLPKGVMVGHASLINLCTWHQRNFAVDAGSRATVYANIAFDASVWEVWPYLLAGACLYPLGDELTLDLEELVDFFTGQHITHCFLPSPVCAELHQSRLPVPEHLYVTTGGDELRITGEVRMNIVNNYGPTESTVVTTAVFLKGEMANVPLPIGKPIDNIQVFLLDDAGHRVPVGVDGEIFIAGAALAKGYLNDKQLTAGKFRKHPFSHREHDLVYATGDLACWRNDGNLVFKGRKDSQVKLRGYRIEPGEIQACLLKHPQVLQAVVLLKNEPSGNKYLCAYYTAAGELPKEILRNWLLASLPEYMVPAGFIYLDRLPLTPNGKTDTKALLEIPVAVVTEAVDETMYDAMEVRMVQVWRNALNAEQLGLHDNFFSQGGDSIKAIRLAYEVNEAFGANIKLMDIFKYDTPGKLLNRLQQANNHEEEGSLRRQVIQQINTFKNNYLSKYSGPDKEEVLDVYPVADIQLGMLYHGLYGEGGALYHDQILHQVRYPAFEPERFNQALRLMAARHEILRTAFDLSDMEAPAQLVYQAVIPEYAHHDLTEKNKAAQETYIQQWLVADRARPFDSTKSGLWRVNTFSLGREIVVVILVCHHAIIDGWSDATFSTELNNTYLRLKQEPAFVPGKLSLSYKAYVTDECVAKSDEQVKAFWKEELAGWQRTRFLFALDDEGSTTQVYNLDLGPTLKQQLMAFARANTISPREICFSVYLQVIRSLALGEEGIVGLHTHNRPLGKDSGEMLGCFLNTLPVKYTFADNVTWLQHVDAVHKKVMQVTANGHLSLFEIAKLNAATDTALSQNPFFDTLFAYLDFHVYHNLDANQQDVDSTFGRRDLEVTGQGLNNTFLNFIFNTTLNECNLLVFYKSTQIDQSLVTHIASTFKNNLQSLLNDPHQPIQETVGNASTIEFNL